MAKIDVFKSHVAPWVTYKADPGAGGSRERHSRGVDEPQLFEVKASPNLQGEVHAHEQDEIIYIVAGQMIFGRHVLNPGDSIAVPGMVLYSFKAGPEGVQFINFRPQKDPTYYRKDEFMKLQKLEPGARAEYREQLITVRRAEVGRD